MSNNEFLSPHFRLSEFEASRTAAEQGIANVAPPEAVENLRRLCEDCLEPLREALGRPIVITSGYRCQRLNEILVHAARKSQHMVGCAADFYVGSGHTEMLRQAQQPEIAGQARNEGPSTGSGTASRRELLIEAFRLIIESPDIDYDQLIIYPSFIHVSYVSATANRHKLTKGFGNGKYCALSRADALAIV